MKNLKKLVNRIPNGALEFTKKINNNIQIGLTQPDDHWDKWNIKPKQSKWQQFLATIKISFGSKIFKRNKK